MSERNGYYPEMLIEYFVYDGPNKRMPLREYAKRDPQFAVARLCQLSKEHERWRTRIEELEREKAEANAIIDRLIAALQARPIPAGVVALVDEWENRYSHHRSPEESAAAHTAQDCANELAAAIEAEEE